MLTETSKFIIIVFGLFFIGCGGLMLLNPVKAREILRKAGSTNFINYAEITLRMVLAISLSSSLTRPFGHTYPEFLSMTWIG